MGTYDINEFILNAHSLPTGILALAAYGALIAAAAKSSQFPFHTWLPDAMEAPTPISALIHAATMVNAGVYLLARFYPAFKDCARLDNGCHVGRYAVCLASGAYGHVCQ